MVKNTGKNIPPVRPAVFIVGLVVLLLAMVGLSYYQFLNNQTLSSVQASVLHGNLDKLDEQALTLTVSTVNQQEIIKLNKATKILEQSQGDWQELSFSQLSAGAAVDIYYQPSFWSKKKTARIIILAPSNQPPPPLLTISQ